MSKNPAIETTGEIRQFLLRMISEIEKGDMPLDKANCLCKTIGRLHESLLTETRIMVVKMAAGERLSEFGSLLIGSIPNHAARLDAPRPSEKLLS